MLTCDKGELNRWASLKRVVQYRFGCLFGRPFVHLFVNLSVCLFICLCCLAICLCVVCLSVYLLVHLSVSLWVCPCAQLFVQPSVIGLSGSVRVTTFSYRTEEEDARDVKKFKRKGENFHKKLQLLPSLQTSDLVTPAVHPRFLKFHVLTTGG